MKHLASMTLKAVAAASTLLALPEANRVAWAMEVENNDRPPRQGMSAGPPGLMLRARTANPSYYDITLREAGERRWSTS